MALCPNGQESVCKTDLCRFESDRRLHLKETKTKLIVYHSNYGCATGCCGHTVEDTETGEKDFQFDHPYPAKTEEEFKIFAEDLIRNLYGEEHVSDLDWENCIVSNC